MTGTKTDGSLTEDLKLGLQSTATLVILMGMNKLGRLHNYAKTMGKEIFQRPSFRMEPWQISELGFQLQRNLKLWLKEDLRNPAIIVIGEVVGHAKPEWWKKS